MKEDDIERKKTKTYRGSTSYLTDIYLTILPCKRQHDEAFPFWHFIELESVWIADAPSESPYWKSETDTWDILDSDSASQRRLNFSWVAGVVSMGPEVLSHSSPADIRPIASLEDASSSTSRMRSFVAFKSYSVTLSLAAAKNSKGEWFGIGMELEVHV